jgi:ABC-2 type transport system ATP-binding protein
MELTAQNITKKIRNKLILDGISLKLIGGRIYVIKGANGSGKTMLLRALSGLMSIDSGIITLDGKVLRRDYSVLPSLGIMLENVSLCPNMTGFQNLEYLAKLKGKVGAEEIRDAIGRVGL